VATQPSSPARDPGTTSEFQMPPRVSAATGAGMLPSPARAKARAPAPAVAALPACSTPATNHGALAATARARTRHVCARLRAAAASSRARAAATPALALSDASGSRSSRLSGTRPVRAQVRPATTIQGSAAYPMSTGQCPSCRRSSTSGFHS
jgi:hypothetical protein